MRPSFVLARVHAPVSEDDEISREKNAPTEENAEAGSIVRTML